LSSKESARKFEFIREVASGGFGSVYLAKVIHPDGFSRLVAIKLLHRKWSANDEIASRMRDEARLLGWLRHRNIVDVMDLTMIDGRSAVVMEYLEAVDVRVLIEDHHKRGDRFPLRAALDICAAAASALDAAYNRPPFAGEKPLRVIHRDIKPSNLMVDGQGQVKVLDFGVARAEFDAREAKTAELSFGSLEYMPPERLFFEPESPASDIYSLGATLYEMLALQKLGKAKLRQGEQERFIEERFEDLLQSYPIPSEEQEDLLHDLLKDMLAFDENDRPSAADLVTRMRSFGRQLGSEAAEEWAERVVPGLVAAQRDGAPTNADNLIGRVITEDVSDAAEETTMPRGELPTASRDELVPPPKMEPAKGRDDERWSALKQATLASLTETGELGAGTVKQVRQIAASKGLADALGDFDDPDEEEQDGPTVLIADQELRMQALEGLLGDLPEPPNIYNEKTVVQKEPQRSSSSGMPPRVPQRPPPPPVTAEGPGRGAALGMVAGALLLAVVAVVLVVVLVVVLGLGGLYATDDVASTPEPTPVPGPAPVPTPPPEPATVQPLPAGDGVSFLSAMPDTVKIVVRCTGGNGEGREVAVVRGDIPGRCRITAQTGARKRRTAVVEAAEPRPYTCFEGDADTCE
jgi:hypothetical protein